jgi:hypothetical protein
MRLYRVYISDRFTKIPLSYVDIKALTKHGAKRKVFNTVCKKDTSYILIVGLAPKQRGWYII